MKQNLVSMRLAVGVTLMLAYAAEAKASSVGVSAGPAWYDGQTGFAGHLDYRSSSSRVVFWQVDGGFSTQRKFSQRINTLVGAAVVGLSARGGGWRASIGIGGGVNWDIPTAAVAVAIGMGELGHDVGANSFVSAGYRYEVLYFEGFNTPKHRLFVTYRWSPRK